jgi:hypothetical protein
MEYLTLTILMLLFLSFHTTNYITAQSIGNMTSKCSNGNCTTIICIYDSPCETITSNPNNVTGLRDFLENKTKVTLVPREII